MIKLQSASLSYKKFTALSDINLQIFQGETLALVGHSGSGKSSLLKLIYNQQTDKNSHMTLIPQEYALAQNLSVFHNVYMGQLGQHPSWYNLLNLIKPLTKPVEDVRHILQQVNLTEKIFSPVAELSGGQQQRTAVARALMHSSNTLLADEPISSLDENQSQVIMRLLCEQFETCIFSLHDIDLALQFCDRVIGLDKGEIVIDAPAEALTRKDLLELYAQ